MMIRAAGGPGLISPIDFAERRKPMPRWMALAIGGSVLAHAALGVVLYTQRFEIATAQPDAPAEPKPTVVTFVERPKAKPEPADAAPATPLNRPAAPTVPTETLAVTPADATPAEGPVISLTAVPEPTGVTTALAPVEAVVPAPAPLITQPEWRRRPTADQLARAYPEGALARGVSGSATLTCAVTASGSVTGCRVTAESPQGQGFGRAAERLSRYFVMNPRTVDGAPVAGAQVLIPLKFDAPE